MSLIGLTRFLLFLEEYDDDDDDEDDDGYAEQSEELVKN